MPYMDPNVYEHTFDRDSASAIDEQLFCVVAADAVAIASAGGAQDGVSTSTVTAAGTPIALFTQGVVLVKVGAAGVTADHDVMVATGGKAVDATFGNLAVARALDTVASGGVTRVLLYARPFQAYGSGLGVERVAKVSLTGNAIHGGVQAWQNPTGVSILITKIAVDITTVSTGASTLDIGTTATDATTASDNLIDGASGAAAVVLDNTVGGGANGKGAQKLAAGKWVTFKEASGDTSGAVLDGYIFYVLLA
jgi:hypothetical protein